MLTIDYAILHQNSRQGPGRKIQSRAFVHCGRSLCLRYHLLPERFGIGLEREKKRQKRIGQIIDFCAAEGIPALWMERELAEKLHWPQPELTEELVALAVELAMDRNPFRPVNLLCVDEPGNLQRQRFGEEKLSRAVWLLRDRLNRLVIVTDMPRLYEPLFDRLREDTGLVGICTDKMAKLPENWRTEETMVLDLAGKHKFLCPVLNPAKFLDTIVKNGYNTLIVKADSAKEDRGESGFGVCKKERKQEHGREEEYFNL